MNDKHDKNSAVISAADIMKIFNLEKLPEEGGFYRRTYISEEKVLLERGSRACSTAIYYLITPEEFSTLHKVKSDEIFHFYAGDSVEMLQINEMGESFKTTLGSNFLAGEIPQVIVKKGIWQGTRLLKNSGWALLGCTVSPGFEFTDFETGSREYLTKKFPILACEIEKYT